ncbi:MAG: DUF3489 domain-containing protein [Silicimonas sp.]|nr:DUF3489 domain-containing protein [Silicimonas sp.]
MTTKKLKTAARNATNGLVAEQTKPSANNRRTTRKAQMIRLLSRKNGADVIAITKQFGWQPHTTRAALSRLRKDGYEVIRDRASRGKPARYRIPQVSPGKAAANAG